MTLKEVIAYGERLFPDHPYQEAVEFGRTAEWWKRVACKLADMIYGDEEPEPDELSGHPHYDRMGDST